MAIMHFRVSHVSRSTGRSSVQSAAYITGERLIDARTDETVLYQRFEGEIYSYSVMAPENASPEFKTLEGWNLLEKYEDEWANKFFKNEQARDHHKNSARISMNIIGALPRELTLAQGEELVREFVQKSFVDKGHYVTYAIHNEEGNPHVHMMVSHRFIDENGEISSAKNRILCTRAAIKNHRQLWAEITNNHLEMTGHEQRVTASSYVDMGIDLIPTVHEGWYPQSLVKQGELSFIVEENQRIREENKNKILENPMIVLDYMTKTTATFTMPQLMAKIEDFFPGNEKAVSYVYQAISDNLVLLGEDVSTEVRFTSRDYQEIENKAIQSFEAIREQSWGPALSDLDVMKHIYAINEQLVEESGDAQAQLNKEQRQAIEGICRNDQVSILVGRAGAGKTTSLRAIKNIFEENRCQIFGTALSASAAKNLGDDTGCFSETVRFYIHKWEQLDQAHEILNSPGKEWSDLERKSAQKTIQSYGKYDLTDKSVFLVDEASMIGTRDWQKILERVQIQHAKLVIVGDGRQFSAIDAGDIHRYMEDNIRNESRFVLSEINRQKVDWMREASVALSNQNVPTALATYENKGHIVAISKESGNDGLYQAVAKDYVNRFQESKNGVVLAYTNETCQNLNRLIRQDLQKLGLLSRDETKVLGINLCQGDRVVFLNNHRSNEGVEFINASGADVTNSNFIRNGTRGTVESIVPMEREVEGKKVSYHQLTIKLADSLTLKIDSDKFSKDTLSHGYALTTHKSQGQTIDWTLVVASKHMDSSAVYVAMTRHRYDMRMYYSQGEFESFAKLQHVLGRSSYKDMARDYTIQDQNKVYFNNVESYRLLTMEMAELIAHENIYEKGEPKERLEKLEEARIDYGTAILDNFAKHALYAAQAKLTEQQIKITCGLEERPLSLAEKEAKARIIEYVGIAKNCRDTWNRLSKSGIGESLYTHPSYLKYEEAKQIRDTLALQITLNKPLHKTFMREVGNNLGYGMNVIETQAKHALYRYDFEANKAGLERHLETYETSRVDLKSKEFWKTDAFKERGTSSLEIAASHLHERDQKLPKLTMMLAQSKDLDFVKIKQDALDYNRMIFANQLQDPSEQRHAELLVSYNIVKREAGRLYGVCAVEKKDHQGQFLPLNQTKGYQAYAEIKQVRDTLAEELSKLDSDRTTSLSNLFGINVSKIQENPKSIDKNLERIAKAQADYNHATLRKPITFEDFKHQQLTLNEIEGQLKDNIISLAQDLFQGEKVYSKTSSQIRFGAKGSKCVIISGQKQGVYSDFETGDKGNTFKLIQSRLGLSFKESVDWAQRWLGNPTKEQIWQSVKETQQNQQKSFDEKRFVTLYPAPKEPVHIKDNKFLSYALDGGKETMRFAYLDADKNLLGYVVRIEKGSNKVTLPLTYCRDLKSNKDYWKWRGFGKEAPLYGLDQLSIKPNAPVLVVEGEKAADAARKQFKNYAVVSWPGGASAVSNANWTVLKGRDVVMWPDNDKAGFAAAHRVQQACAKIGAHTVSIVRLPHQLPEKWDLADAYPTNFDVTKAHVLVKDTLAHALTEKQFKVEHMAKIDQMITSNSLMEDVSIKVKLQALDTFAALANICKEVGVNLTDADNNHLLKQTLYMSARSEEFRQSAPDSPNKLDSFIKAQETAFLESLFLKKTQDYGIAKSPISVPEISQLRKDYTSSIQQIHQALSGNQGLSEPLKHAISQEVVQMVNLCPALKDNVGKLISLQVDRVTVNLTAILDTTQKLEGFHPNASKEQVASCLLNGLRTSQTPQQAMHKVMETIKSDTKEMNQQVQRYQTQQQMRGGALSF